MATNLSRRRRWLGRLSARASNELQKEPQRSTPGMWDWMDQSSTRAAEILQRRGRRIELEFILISIFRVSVKFSSR